MYKQYCFKINLQNVVTTVILSLGGYFKLKLDLDFN